MERTEPLHITMDKKRSQGFKLQQGRYGLDTQLPSVMVRETHQELAGAGSAISITCGRKKTLGATARKGLGVTKPSPWWGWMRRPLHTPSSPICQGCHAVRLPAR